MYSGEAVLIAIYCTILHITTYYSKTGRLVLFSANCLLSLHFSHCYLLHNHLRCMLVLLWMDVGGDNGGVVCPVHPVHFLCPHPVTNSGHLRGSAKQPIKFTAGQF